VRGRLLDFVSFAAEHDGVVRALVGDMFSSTNF